MYIKCINAAGVKTLTKDKIYYLLAIDNMRLKARCDNGVNRWINKNRFLKVAHNTKDHAAFRRQYLKSESIAN